MYNNVQTVAHLYSLFEESPLNCVRPVPQAL